MESIARAVKMNKTFTTGNDAQPVSAELKSAPPKSNVYTVQPYQPFLDSVARGILDENNDDPLALADMTVLVPDRETAFALRQSFIEQMGGRPAVMPQI